MTPVDRANAVLGLYEKAITSFNEEAENMWLTQNGEWQDELIKQHGGEDKLEPHLAKIGGLIEAYEKDKREAHESRYQGVSEAPPVPEFGTELRQMMTLTGAGNNPQVMNFLFWVADQLGEGSPLTGGPAAQDLSRAEKLFGT